MAKTHINRLPEILDCYAQGRTDAEIARKLGITDRTLRNYLQRSMHGDEKMVCEWNGITAQYVEHVKTAMSFYGFILDQQVRADVLHGEKIPMLYKGRPTYIMHPECETTFIDPDDRELNGFSRDGIMRDEFGEKMVETVRMPVPAALKIKLIESILPRTYAKVQKIEHQIGGIVRLTSEGAAIDEKQMKQIEAPKAHELISPAEREDEEQKADDPIVALSETAATPEEFEKWASEGAFDHKPVTLERADGAQVQVGKEGVQIMPQDDGYIIDPVYGRITHEQKATFDKLKASTPAGASKVPHGAVRAFSAADETAEKSTDASATQAAPAMPQVAEGGSVDPVTGLITPHAVPVAAKAAPAAFDWNKHPRVIEARQKFANDQPLTAIDRQILAGNFDVLKSSGAEADHVGAGGPPKDAAAIATVTTARPSGRRAIV